MERLSEPDFDAVFARGSGEHFEDGSVVELESLGAIGLLSGLAPVAGAADSANDEAAIGGDNDPVNAGL